MPGPFWLRQILSTDKFVINKRCEVSNMKSLKKNALMFPAGYGKISKEEAYGIEGGIGPATYTDGSYDTHQNASEITKKWEGFFERIFDLDYEQRQTVNKGFGLSFRHSTRRPLWRPSILHLCWRVFLTRWDRSVWHGCDACWPCVKGKLLCTR